MSVKARISSTPEDQERKLIPVDSRWRQRIRELTGTSSAADIAARTMPAERATAFATKLRSWISTSGPCSAPGIGSLRELASAIDYPLVEQLTDLEYLTRADLELIDSPLLAPGWILAERLERLLSQARRGSSNVGDLVAALRADTIRTGDLARWRARVFDIPAGTETYRHIGYHAVEFEVWLGPTPSEEPEVRLRERVHKGQEVLSRLVPSSTRRQALIQKYGPIKDMSPDLLVGCLERTELEHRLVTHRAASHFNTYGLDGELGAPLVGSAHPGSRHIYVEPASKNLEGRDSKAHTPDKKLFGPAEKVLLIAPPAATPLALGHLVGRALGWDVRSLREAAGTAAGTLIRIRDQDTAATALDRAVRSFRTASGGTAPEILVTNYTKHLSSTAERRNMLLDESVFPVLLRPTHTSLEAWAARQRFGQAVTKPMDPDEVEKELDALEETLLLRADSSERLQFQVDMEWWPRAGGSARFAEQAQFFEAPSIGDIRLKAAYQLACLFIRGHLPNAKTPETYFMDGPIARFTNTLRADADRPLRRSRRKTNLNSSD